MDVYIKYTIFTVSMTLVLLSCLISTSRLSYTLSINDVNWIDICNQLQSAFHQSCSAYVNPDNTLTPEGKVALKCTNTDNAPGIGTACKNIVKQDELNAMGQIRSITNLIP